MEKIFEAKRVIVTRFKVSGTDLKDIVEKVKEAMRDELLLGSMLRDMIRGGIDESDTIDSIVRIPDPTYFPGN